MMLFGSYILNIICIYLSIFVLMFPISCDIILIICIIGGSFVYNINIFLI